MAASRRVFTAREAVAALLGVRDASRVLFTASATESLNLAVKGLLRPGDHCITTAAEHNALRRPLIALEWQGVQVTWLPVGPDGLLDPDQVARAVRPETRLIALAHGSNVSGALQPVAGLAEIARRSGAFLLLDAAQTAGAHPLAVEAQGIHLLAAPGHKGLLGPQGSGILYVHESVPLQPIREGGTGTMAQSPVQPAIFPEGFESGTLALPAIAGLGAGAAFLLELGVAAVRRRERDLAAALADGLRSLDGVTVYGPLDPDQRCGVISFNLNGIDPAEVEERLDEEFGVIGRAGLHCNPGAHAALGTDALGGAMRLSPGCFTAPAEIDAAVRAVAALTRTGGGRR